MFSMFLFDGNEVPGRFLEIELQQTYSTGTMGNESPPYKYFTKRSTMKLEELGNSLVCM